MIVITRSFGNCYFHLIVYTFSLVNYHVGYFLFKVYHRHVAQVDILKLSFIVDLKIDNFFDCDNKKNPKQGLSLQHRKPANLLDAAAC